MIDINIAHYPITKTDQVAKLYSEKDGVDVKYVCTTELSDTIADIFYRPTPHPTFGNKYFAVLFRDDVPYIAGADHVEDLVFGIVENDNGAFEYSRSRHDFKSFKNGNMIDGGRDYIRSAGNVLTCVVRDGSFIRTGVNYHDQLDVAKNVMNQDREALSKLSDDGNPIILEEPQKEE